MPAILATTPSAMVVFPRVSAGAPAPVRPLSALTPASGRLPPPTLVMLSVMAVASIGPSDTGAVPFERLDISSTAFLTRVACDVHHMRPVGYADSPNRVRGWRDGERCFPIAGLGR